MGLFGGPRRQEGPSEDRSLSMPEAWQAVARDFASGDPSRPGTAVQSVAVGVTVDLIASLVSELPVETYSRSGKKINTPENVLDPGGDGQGVEDWLYRLLSSWLLAGNGYGVVLAWDAREFYAKHIDLFSPDDVTVQMIDGRPQWRVSGKVFEDQSNFVHRRVNPVAGRLLGLSPIEKHAATIGISLSATRFGRQWFTDGAHPAGMLTNDGVLSPESAAEAKKRFMARAQGSREPLVLGKGWDFKEIQVSPEESQFLETQGFSEAQCARIFGPGWAELLGYPTGSSMTYANVVDRRQDVLTLSANRWIRRADRMLSLLTPRPQYVRLNRDAFLEATTLERYQAHALAGTWRTVNETRDIEDLPPIEGGDTLPGKSTPTTAPAGGDNGAV